MPPSSDPEFVYLILGGKIAPNGPYNQGVHLSKSSDERKVEVYCVNYRQHIVPGIDVARVQQQRGAHFQPREKTL